MCDFETTVYSGQQCTEVWASAVSEFFRGDEVLIHHSIEETFEYFKNLNTNVVCYYHNLKFDGHFWLDYLQNVLHYEQAYDPLPGDSLKWQRVREMKANTFRYTISDLGQWYMIEIKVGQHKSIEIRDSLKLLPFSVKEIGKAFKTQHQKLEMEYEGYRYAGCEITEEEREYIANDVLVVKEALEIMYRQGHNKLTIGSCCLEEFKSTFWNLKDYEDHFPNLYEIEIDPEIFGSSTAGEYIHRSYRGGWCYLVKEKAGKLLTNGTTADVNSLYPSMMSSESNNWYPIGKPVFWSGDFIPPEAEAGNRYYFVRIRTRFRLKDGYLPCIQIKRSAWYRSNEWLKTSDIWDPYRKEYVSFLPWMDGTIEEMRPTLTLTMTDYRLIRDHYDLYDFEILDGCWFTASQGMFDDYIEKYKKIKQESKGAMRTLAKLFLNNLYGKMASSTNSSFKVCFTKEDGTIGFRTIEEHGKKPGYIAIGSAITSYARNFTIRAAQKNFHGIDKPGFIYADTDSIHCDLDPDQIEGIRVHEKNFCCWKLESCWDQAVFVRQKTYMEHVTKEDLTEVEPHWDVKCAGMPDSCKNLFLASIGERTISEEDQMKLSQEARDFLKTKRTIHDFRTGLQVPGKLIPKRIRGGIVLVEDVYTMRE